MEPPEINAPGLKWRTRSNGMKVAYWVCNRAKVYEKFKPRTVRLWSGHSEPSTDELSIIEAGCQRMRQETVEFAMNPRRNRRAKRKSGSIYFIRSRNLVKIGFTAGDPTVRLNKLQIGSPVKLELLGYVEGDDVIERQLHWRFKSHHSHGEWFFIEGSLCTYIKKLFDAESPPEQQVNRA